MSAPWIPSPIAPKKRPTKILAGWGLQPQNAAAPTVNGSPDEESLHDNPLWSVTTLGSAGGLDAVPKVPVTQRQSPSPPPWPAGNASWAMEGLSLAG